MEKDSRRLMDCAENSLSVVGKFTEECANRPRGLTVKTRCRFVEEEKERWLGCKLYTDCKSLPLLDIKSYIR